MSDIGTDTREIAARMMPWDSPPTYTSKEVPDWELLRVHALRLADAFHGVRDRWQETGSQLARLREENPELRRRLAQAEERVKALKKALADMWTLRQEAANARDGARADVERLQAIVDRLPKTADGVPLVPGMTVFIPHPHPSNLITERVVLAPYGTLACLTKEPAHSGCCESATHRQARECYSTRKAAEAARKANV